MTASGIYVYGIVGSSHGLPPGAVGVGEPPAPVRLLPVEDLAVVVSAAYPGLRARRRDLMAHQGLLMALAETGPVLPMRFGMVAPDEATVLAGVAARGSEHAAVLERLDSRIEMNIKITPVQDNLAALIREDPVVRGFATRRAVTLVTKPTFASARPWRQACGGGPRWQRPGCRPNSQGSPTTCAPGRKWKDVS